MYNSQEIANRIKQAAKQKNVPIGEMLSNCGLGLNTVSKIAKGADVLTLNFSKIADYLDVSVDYLLGRPEKGLNEDENNLITAYRQSSMDTKKAARAVLGLKEA